MAASREEQSPENERQCLCCAVLFVFGVSFEVFFSNRHKRVSRIGIFEAAGLTDGVRRRSKSAVPLIRRVFAPIRHQRFPRSSFRMTTNGITTPWKETHFVDNDVAIEAMQTNPSAKRARRERGVLTGNNENTAFMWWEDHLRSAGWIKFRPRECENVGFIPVQYTAGVFPRNVVRHVLKHGERGTHYAIGWWQLYEIVMSYSGLH